jgi:hypothetical protein
LGWVWQASYPSIDSPDKIIFISDIPGIAGVLLVLFITTGMEQV